MHAVGAQRPEANADAEVILLGGRASVSTRVERVETDTLVVRPSSGDFDDDPVVRVGDAVQVFWRDAVSGWSMPARVATVERGTHPRWHLDVVGAAEHSQRREAVRVRLTLPVVVRVGGTDLEGETLDVSEGGVRAVVDAYGHPPEPGTVVPLTVRLEDVAVAAPAEVVRHQARGAKWGLSLRFVDLPEKLQDRMRRRVFQAMREERARGAD
ncbi:flagellar brake protein [Geodermatophilus sp. DSM 44513]|uniref:flagellar brake protein n=1 Tax=Geodermatophilus sp. DSM 44513 TaxID=1528104 RepID=UPI00128533AA|nr:PilZ domain-containing protein [Geodermatophilus sp. DSM 44513]WNV75740.1 PilZ domain-containing protein [Geodermatophilus sp. DSM 44513]